MMVTWLTTLFQNKFYGDEEVNEWKKKCQRSLMSVYGGARSICGRYP